VISTYRLFRIGAKIAPLLPVWLGNGLSDLIGGLIYALTPTRRRVVMCNLSHVLADKPLAERRRVSRAMFRSTIRNYYDLLRVHALSSEQRLAQVELRNIHLVYEAFKRGRGIMAIACHQGSFSFVTQLASLVDFDFFLTVEPVEPPELFEFVRKLRGADPRNHTIAIGGSEVRAIFRALKDNHMVCLAIDRDVSGNGKPLSFFGAEAILPTGAAEIALRTGTYVMPIQIYRIAKGRHALHFHPGFVAEPSGDKAADLINTSTRMLGEIERMIRVAPEDWVVMQPVWPDCQ